MKKRIAATLLTCLMIFSLSLFAAGCNSSPAKSSSSQSSATSAAGEYTVTFYAPDGAELEAVTVNAGEGAAAPDLADGDVYVFGGWYLDGGDPYANTPVQQDTSVYAKNLLVDALGVDCPFSKEALSANNIVFPELEVDNEVMSVWAADGGYVVLDKIYYGEQFYENPSLQAYVGFDLDGNITNVLIGETVDHTLDFLAQVDDAYIRGAYSGQPLSQSFVADTVAGATYSSNAVLYAVQTASYYVNKTYGVGIAAIEDSQIKKLAKQMEGKYTKQAIDQAFVSETGEITYVARGKTTDGRDVAAFILKSKYIPENPDSTMGGFALQVIVDKGTNKVISTQMTTNGVYSGLRDLFGLPYDKLQAYEEVEITSATAFDDFVGGLVTDNPEEVITSATGSFDDVTTGATPGGTDTSKAIKGMFKTVAQYYVKHFLG